MKKTHTHTNTHTAKVFVTLRSQTQTRWKWIETIANVTKLLKICVNNPSRKNPKNPDQHLKLHLTQLNLRVYGWTIRQPFWENGVHIFGSDMLQIGTKKQNKTHQVIVKMFSGWPRLSGTFCVHQKITSYITASVKHGGGAAVLLQGPDDAEMIKPSILLSGSQTLTEKKYPSNSFPLGLQQEKDPERTMLIWTAATKTKDFRFWNSHKNLNINLNVQNLTFITSNCKNMSAILQKGPLPVLLLLPEPPPHHQRAPKSKKLAWDVIE